MTIIEFKTRVRRNLQRRGRLVPFTCGDRVVDKADPRHEGRIESISNTIIATVRWTESGWKSQVTIDQLVRT